MLRCAAVVISVALAACAGTTPTERERALGKLPSQAQLVAAADGPSLAKLRPLVDAARAFVPAKLDCVIDAALTGEAIAVAVAPDVGTTIVVVTRAVVARCPTLSKIDRDLYVATLGAGALATSRDASPLVEPQWARARSYLLRDPIAIAAQHDGQRVLAVAQPEPLAGWVSIDATDPVAVEKLVAKWRALQRSGPLASFADSITVEARGSQVLVRASKPRSEDAALLVTHLLRALDAPARSPAVTFTCPAPAGGIVRCNGNDIIVTSLAAFLRKVSETESEPAIAGSDIIGIRLRQDVETLLHRGDVILAVDGYGVTSAEQLRALAPTLTERATLAVRRDGADIILGLSE